MNRISNFQLYCLLLFLVAPVAVLEQPHRLVHIAHNNAWLMSLLSFLPGMLIILMYAVIIKKSSQPFPHLLEEHLGKIAGKAIGILYVFIFLLVCAFNLRVFIEFMKMIVLPATPISIFIGVLLLLGIYAIKTGILAIARTTEILAWIGVSFTLLITTTSVLTTLHLDRLLPVAYIDMKSLSWGIVIATSVLGKMMPVLSLAFFLPEKKTSTKVMAAVLATYALVIAYVTAAVTITVGTYPSQQFVFPTFNMIRLASIGEFIQNLDIAFIAVWIFGIFGAVTVSWFMACFTGQQVLNLKDYRFLAAPSALIIGILSILIGKNNLEIVLWSTTAVPFIFIFFFILVPFLIFLICCFKPVPEIPSKQNADSSETLHKQGMTG